MYAIHIFILDINNTLKHTPPLHILASTQSPKPLCIEVSTNNLFLYDMPLSSTTKIPLVTPPKNKNLRLGKYSPLIVDLSSHNLLDLHNKVKLC